jgi:hypothetical protein
MLPPITSGVNTPPGAEPGPGAPVLFKGRMYGLLAGGVFGNTIPQYFSLEKWEASADHARYDAWGVRTLVPGGPCRLYCPREEVAATVARPEFRAAGVNISVMIDAVLTVTAWLEVLDTDVGLIVYGVEFPGKGASWRKDMPVGGRQHGGLAARMLLRKHLNPSSLADLEALLERYPGHVVELSACDRCFGTVPGRNAIIWEVRKY